MNLKYTCRMLWAWMKHYKPHSVTRGTKSIKAQYWVWILLLYLHLDFQISTWYQHVSGWLRAHTRCINHLGIEHYYSSHRKAKLVCVAKGFWLWYAQLSQRLCFLWKPNFFIQISFFQTSFLELISLLCLLHCRRTSLSVDLEFLAQNYIGLGTQFLMNVFVFILILLIIIIIKKRL